MSSATSHRTQAPARERGLRILHCAPLHAVDMLPEMGSGLWIALVGNA
ncbi:hypothetical protein XCR_4216 [Xanthomonas campestris pv. raphani 756C]|nr:hypothetical protein XCR_4216 [Xanthomonas campestris pv. raphani 756C]